MATVGETLLHPGRALAVVVCFLAVGAALVYHGLAFMETETNWSDFLPRGSPLLDFINMRDKYFGRLGNLDFITSDVDIRVDEHIVGLEELRNLTTNGLDFAVSADNWYVGLTDWLESRGQSLWDFAEGDSNRTALLLEWVGDANASTGGLRYAQQPAFIMASDGDGVLRSSRVTIVTSIPRHVKHRIRDMNTARNRAAKIRGIGVRATTREYGWLVREENIIGYTTDTLVKTLVGVLATALCFLEPWLALATTVSVALSLCGVFGIMPLWNLRLNVSSFINLVLAVGFSVDYSAHIAEGYMVKSKALAPRPRLLLALKELGGSVLNGGLSTFCGVLVLAFSQSAGFQTLFRMFFCMVVFGLAHGLIFLPCVIFLLAVSFLRLDSLLDYVLPWQGSHRSHESEMRETEAGLHGAKRPIDGHPESPDRPGGGEARAIAPKPQSSLDGRDEARRRRKPDLQSTKATEKLQVEVVTVDSRI